MLVEKEVARPGTYWYRDEATGLPRKLVVTPELTRYWSEQGNAMLSAGLTVPVPFEHDFNAHPMTPADKLLNNSGWVKQYKLSDGKGGPGDRLFSVLDIQDADVAKKLPGTIRWTSPWINSFTDGAGKEWKNVISHLALTTRPRIVDQAPFGSVAAALSMATGIKSWAEAGANGVCLSRAGLLSSSGLPAYPIAFSLISDGVNAALGFPPPKQPAKGAPPKAGNTTPDANPTPDEDIEAKDKPAGDAEVPPGDLDGDGDADADDATALLDQPGDVAMEELLCDLLGALGIQCENGGNEEMFKRNLYNAAMTKIHELTGKAQNAQEQPQQPVRSNPPGQPPNNTQRPGQQNPLIQQEQQPMFMSLEDINKISDPTMHSIALSFYNENVKLRNEAAADRSKLNSLNDAKLKEENSKRATRVALLGRLSPRAKADLDAMVAMPAMALSMGDGGAVVDPMAQTLAVLEKGLADLPRLLTTDASALSVQPQPQDADMLTDARADEIADSMARQMGCPPQAKAG